MVSRALVLSLLCLAGACAADGDGGGRPDIHIVDGKDANASSFEVEQYVVDGDDAAADPCELAAALPRADICSLMCEPDQFAARLLSDGTPTGACYHLLCKLTPSVAVSVGVCLP